MKVAILIFYIFLIPIFNFGNEYPEIGHNNFGTEFILTVPPNLSIPNQENNEFVDFIFFSPFDTKVILEIPSKGYHKELSLKANTNNGFKIPASIVQPFIKTGYIDNYFDILIKNSAVNIKSDMPISVMVLSDFDNSADSYLALPKEHLGNNYVVSSYNDVSDYYESYRSLKSNVSIVATNDSTVVELFYPAENSKIDPKGIKISGETFIKVLNKNDIWVVSSIFNKDDLSNARILSNHPISVISSNQCANIPFDNKWCDFIMNMETPTEYWGYSYIVSKYDYKRFEPVIRVYAKESNTDIFIDGIYYETIGNVFDPDIKSYIEIIRTKESNFNPNIISSNKPIQVTSYSTGDEEDLKSPNGGPSMLNIPSIESMTNFINISPPNYSQYVSFNNNFVNLLIELDNSNNIPESFEYGFLVGKEFKWFKIKNDLNIKYAKKISNPHNNKTYGVVCLKLPSNGNIKFRSDYKFTMINYGFNEFKSYGFQSHFNLKSNEILDENPPIVNWRVDCDSKIIGQIFEENLKGNLLIPDSNLVNFKVFDKSKNPSEFEIEIIDKRKAASGIIKIWDVYGNITEEKIYYDPPKIKLEPRFVEVTESIGFEFQGYFKIINENDFDLVIDSIVNPIPEVYLVCENNILNIGSTNLLISKNSFKEIYLKGRFDNDTSITSEIKFFDGCYNNLEIDIIINIESPKIFVTDVNFKEVSQGIEVTKDFTIQNIGNVQLTIKDIIYPNFFDFEVMSLPLISNDHELVLAPKSSITGNIRLKSDKLGVLKDSLKIISDAKTVDSICYISCNILSPGLIAESYDFGTIEVVSKKYQKYAKSIDTFKIFNFSSKDIKIKEINLKDQNSTFINLDLEQFKDLTIKKNNYVEYMAEYSPEIPGNHYSSYEIILTDGSISNSNLELKGKAVIPKLNVPDTIDFGKVLINNSKDTSISISNVLYEFNHNLDYIKFELNTNITSNNPYKIINSINNLDIDQNKNISLNFNPSVKGKFEGIINIEGHFEGNKKIILNGLGVESVLNVKDINYELVACQGDKDTIDIVIYNDGNSDLILEPLKFESIIPEFSFLNILDFNDEIIIKPSESLKIMVEFKSFGIDKNTQLIIKEKNKIESKNIQIMGVNKLFEQSYYIKPLKQKVEVSQPALTTLSIENKDIEELNIKNMRVSIKYDPSILSIQEKTIRLSKSLSNDFVIDNIYKPEQGHFQFDLLSLNEKYLEDGNEIINFVFNTYLSNSSNNKSDIHIEIISKDGECINFIQDELAEIETVLDCGNEFQKINSELIPFNLYNLDSNPIIQNSEVVYSNPLSGYVKIDLVDLNGKIVKEYVNKYLDEGYYNFQFDIQNINNGYYMFRYSSNEFFMSKAIIINK